MARTEEKRRLFEVFALVGKGLAHAVRLELLELLNQGERDVDSLAQCSGQSVANTSHHLRQLRHCGLVCSRQEGPRVLYSLAGDDVARLLDLMQRVGMAQLPELDRLLADRFPPQATVPAITPQALAAMMPRQRPALFDLRPRLEYDAGHIPGAVCATLDELRALPAVTPGTPSVMYCRGAFCLLPVQAAAILGEKGYSIQLVAGGFPAWRLAGMPVFRTKR
ncbi:ArsR/SmtB family transcription factor [Megalodesulfovibrio paquesii]